MPALAYAARSTAIWAAGLGAISPLERPSWLTAEPQITASTRSPSRCASVSRLSTTTPAPSPRTNPSAAASKARHLPVGDNAPSWSKPRKTAGDNNKFTPAAIASWESCVRRLWQARWIATNDDEHAVSTATEGPRRSRKYDKRFAMMLIAPPVLLQPSTCGRSVEAIAPYSLRHDPANTPVCERRSELGGIPACSNASQATSSSRRCCGSILSASLGEISKKSASKASMPSRNEPQRVVRASSAFTSGEPSSKRSHRWSGTRPIEERRSQRNCHNSSGPDIAPGNRQPIPMTAIGSSSELPVVRLSADSDSGSGSGAVRYAARALIVGCSQKSIGETVLPNSSVNSPDSTTASREPTPRSASDRAGSTSSGVQPIFVTK